MTAFLKRAFKFKGRGSFVGLQSPGYQLIMAKTDEYAQLVRDLRPPDAERERAEEMLADVRRQIESRIWKLIPYPKYDYAWALLRQLRHLFCFWLPRERLLGMVVEDIAGDIDYLDEGAGAARKELEKLKGEILTLLQEEDEEERRKARGHHEGEVAIRARLEALSRRTAMAREGHWLKVNMTRNRIFFMGSALLVLLLITLWFLPDVLGADQDDPRGLFYWLIVLAGGIGGLISALIGTERLDTRASLFYIRRRLLYLRPVVGGTLGLIAYIALRSGVIAFPALSVELSPLFSLIVAFAAGFSERVFVRRILSAALPAEAKEPEEAETQD